ncbi:hypothetical protein NP493_144g03028 [Ridgeia piscesae]|uniref:Uncharacterized protein n=1 Tax=Ridgeia piscesae TaxID=27915 RepID=A0AAD9UG11_RIDPI|nr:hypothetical protein NP493_144g03028 [Ridgeia piscesae]
MYNRDDISTFDYTKWDVGNVSMRDVYLQHRHLKEDMIALKSICSVGVKHGLQLVVNVEQYDYMKGPNNAETSLPPPHGDCTSTRKLLYFDHYTQAACYRECITNFMVDICGCRDYYMPPFDTG